MSPTVFRPSFCLYLCSIMVCLLLANLVCAQDGAPSGQQAERSELLKSRDAANDTIASGAHDRGQLLPLYLVLARANAQLGEEDAARAAFVRVLALDPNFRPLAEESAEVRSRYLEARGFWSGQGQPLAVEASLAADGKSIALRVVDPGRLAARVRLRARLAGEQRFNEQVRAPERELTIFAIEGLTTASSLEYTLALLDEHGNRIWQEGSEAQPEQLTVPRPSTPVAEIVKAHDTPPDHAGRRRFLWLGGAAALVGVAAGVGASLAQLEREETAREWNEGDCTGSGETRATICSDERQHIERMEWLMGSLYATAGVALIGSLVLFTLAPSRDRTPGAARARDLSYRCHDGPGELGLSCSLSF